MKVKHTTDSHHDSLRCVLARQKNAALPMAMPMVYNYKYKTGMGRLNYIDRNQLVYKLSIKKYFKHMKLLGLINDIILAP